jgi:hypothetical protein
LPFGSVAVTQEGSKVLVYEDPSTAGLGGWQDAALGAAADILGMHLEEGGSFVQGEGLHGREIDGTRPTWRRSFKRTEPSSVNDR